MIIKETAADGVHGPVPVPLPPSPSDAFMHPAAWDVLWALLDGVLPSIVPQSAVEGRAADGGGQLAVPDELLKRAIEAAMATIDDPPTDEDAAAFLAQRSIEDPEFRDDCLRCLAGNPGNRVLGQLFRFMSTRIGSLLLTGHWDPVYKQPAHVRQSIMWSWSQSRFRLLRALASSITVLGHKALGVTSPMYGSLLDYSDAPSDWRPVPGYPSKFTQLEPGNSIHEMETDVVIVGSGPGGAVCAKNLAEAGHKVLLVERGYHFSAPQLPLTQRAAAEYQQYASGALVSEDKSIALVMGSTWGGGGTINWGVSLRLQDFVREQWAQSRGGLPLFSSTDFDDCMDRVMDFIGAQKDIVRHNNVNQILLDGARKLGWHGAPLHRNNGDKEHFCGHCTYGCPSGEKRGPTNAWLPAAAQAGAEFMEGFSVEKVLFKEDESTVPGQVPTAIGIEGLWTSRDAEGGVHTATSLRTQRRVVVKAKRVIVSAGSIWSPVILQKSGLTNPNIGRNLHVHPTIPLIAIYKKETRPWEGGIISTYCKEFEDLDGKGHGAKLEPSAMNPYLYHVMQRWESGLDTKLAALRFNHSQNIVSIIRDRDSGRVFTDAATGTPRFEYTTSKFDASSVLKGLTSTAKIYYATGATEIRSVFSSLAAFRPNAAMQERLTPGQDPELTDPEFGLWLAQMRAISEADHLSGAHLSAHQMGTCAMSGEASMGVVNGRGQVWGTENLFVADSSVFPSASGVNPMVTIMSIADWISRGIASELKGTPSQSTP